MRDRVGVAWSHGAIDKALDFKVRMYTYLYLDMSEYSDSEIS